MPADTGRGVCVFVQIKARYIFVSAQVHLILATADVGLYLCVCVFVYLYFCVFVFLRICVFAYLCICVSVYLCFCGETH